MAMEEAEASARLRRYVELDPSHKGAAAAFWAADEALKALPSGVNLALLEQVFDKLLKTWPEVKPGLDGLPADAWRGFLKAAPRHPGSVWATVLSSAAGEDVEFARRIFAWLTLAASAAPSAAGGAPEERSALRDAAGDRALVKALLEAWPRFDGPLQHRRPIGWAGILLHEGSDAAVRALRPLVESTAAQASWDSTIDDLFGLCPEGASSMSKATRGLHQELTALIAKRDEATGQNGLFAMLKLADPPVRFTLVLTVSAARDDVFHLECSRDRRSTGVHWYASFGKKKPVWSARQSGVERDKPGLGPLTLAELPEWLSRTGAQWKALEVREEGFEPRVEPSVRSWLGVLFAASADRPAKKKPARRTKG